MEEEDQAGPLDPAHVRWLEKNAVPFRSVDPRDKQFDDLEPLKKIIGDARVVLLGEQSHGDGTCFETKIRLVKFLHEQMGFDVLAFESGLYDCRVAWKCFRDGMAPFEAAQQGVFGIWTGSAQTSHLWEYLATQSNAERPLELAGFDCQFTALASGRMLLDDLKSLARKVNCAISDERWAQFNAQLDALTQGRNATGDLTAFEQILLDLKSALSNKEANDNLTSEEIAFWQQQLESMNDHCRRNWEGTEKPTDMYARDEQMAKNLVWLAEKGYPDKKIIVWAASFHIARNLPEIEVPDNSINYSNVIQMGERVHQALGDRAFSIGFTAHEGSAGAFFRPSFRVEKSKAGSLESLCHAAGLENALIPLSNIGEDAKWLENKILARPLGYSWMKASWPKHFDAMIFNRTMTPSTR